MELTTFWDQANQDLIPFGWVDVNDQHVCPDCFYIATSQDPEGHPLSFWQAFGFPGAGHTVCLSKCRCRLVPLASLEEIPGIDPDKSILRFIRDTTEVSTDAGIFALGVDRLRTAGVKLPNIMGMKFTEQKFIINELYEKKFGIALVTDEALIQ